MSDASELISTLHYALKMNQEIINSYFNHYSKNKQYKKQYKKKPREGLSRLGKLAT